MKVKIKHKNKEYTFEKGTKVKISDDCLMPYFRGKTGEIKQLDRYTCLVQGKLSEGVSVWVSYYSLEVI